MASVTKSNPGNEAMSDEASAEDNEREQLPEKSGGGPATARPPSRGGGFFTIYKKGQGYWTRMGTALGAAFLIALTAYQIYHFLPILLNFEPGPVERRTMTPAQLDAAVAHATSVERNIAVIAATVVSAAAALLVWRLMNKPSNADFLIATDS